MASLPSLCLDVYPHDLLHDVPLHRGETNPSDSPPRLPSRVDPLADIGRVRPALQPVRSRAALPEKVPAESDRAGRGSAPSPGHEQAFRPAELATATAAMLDIPAGVRLDGKARAQAVRLGGVFRGEIQCVGGGAVVIEQDAVLAGRLSAQGDVRVFGHVDFTGCGDAIVTRGSLILSATARVRGDVRSAWLQIHAGAVLDGVARGL